MRLEELGIKHLKQGGFVVHGLSNKVPGQALLRCRARSVEYALLRFLLHTWLDKKRRGWRCIWLLCVD